MVLAIDFDGTIHDPHDRDPGFKLGKPIEGAVEALKGLQAEGHTIIVHSLWGSKGRKVMADWLDYFGVPYDEITSEKPDADAYIDDKAIRFTDWPDVLSQL